MLAPLSILLTRFNIFENDKNVELPYVFGVEAYSNFARAFSINKFA